MSTNGDITKMIFNLVMHYVYLFLAGFTIFIVILDVINYSKGMTFVLYGTPVEGWYFFSYMIALLVISGVVLFLSKINLDTHIKKKLDATDNTL